MKFHLAEAEEPIESVAVAGISVSDCYAAHPKWILIKGYLVHSNT